MTTLDRFNRPLGALRISVTDRCNLRCAYCMPAASYRWLPRESLLSFDEIERITRAFIELGVRKLRLTGGEPLLRSNLAQLIRRLSAIDEVTDLALTTNGTRLATAAEELRQAGLYRITVSLDTLDPDALRALTRHGQLSEILAGLDAVAHVGFVGTKMNVVVMRGVNDHLLADLVRFARGRSLEARFIEYMPVGGASEWREELVVSAAEMRQTLGAAFGGVTLMTEDVDPHAPATRWRLGDGDLIGIISSTTAPFCRSCDRARLTADGFFYTCLYSQQGIDLRTPLRAGASHTEMVDLIRGTWTHRDDRGAERRLASAQNLGPISLAKLREDPHLEMHVRGG